MQNPREVNRAEIKYDRALSVLMSVRRLPQEIGACLQWDNGVVWKRVGDDEWMPSTMTKVFPSEHVANTAGWKLVTEEMFQESKEIYDTLIHRKEG